MSSLIDLIESLVKEEISAAQRDQIENVKSGDIITVYHGTPLFRLPQLINGFDAVQVKGRDFNGPKHGGLFVTADWNVAKGFGGGAIIEIQVRANNLHGTDYSGETTRQKKKQGQNFDYIDAQYPNSFRPNLSNTMLQKVEPQGLLQGLVSPKQITRVWIKEGGDWNEYTREEISGKVTNNEYGKERTVKNAGIDLSSPKIQLDDYVEALATELGRDKEQTMATLLRYANMGNRLFSRCFSLSKFCRSNKFS